MKTSLFFRSLKKYCQAALWFYFRTWQVRFITDLPKGPLILVANHQNAFLDAILIICSSHRNPWSIARANIFDKPLAKKLLHAIKILPVYRFRDGFSTLRKNDEIIDSYARLLTQGEAILIFAEGNHDDHWRLRSLQKGFARIAIAAEEKSGYTLGLNIVPVGVQYESPSKYRSRVLVSFGSPISVRDCKQALENNTEKDPAIKDLTEALISKTSEGLRPLILHVEHHEYENKVKYLLHQRAEKEDLVEQLRTDQQLIDRLESSPGEITVPEHSAEKKRPWWNPVYIYGTINHIVPWLIIKWFIKARIRDHQFIPSLQYALGILLVPLAYILQVGICFAISGSLMVTAVYFVSLPLSIALRK
jgi:1-acyl-sn-glycerol-3-phosphate acyltransferase